MGISCKKFLRYKQGGIAVTQEPEVVSEGVIIDGLPVTVYECRHKQKQCALGLVEVGYHHFHYVILVTRSNDDLGTGFEHVKIMSVQIIQYILEGLD